MREFIRPVGGAITPLALMGIRYLWPHKIIGLQGLVVHQAAKKRPAPCCHQSSPRIRPRLFQDFYRNPIKQSHISPDERALPKLFALSCWPAL